MKYKSLISLIVVLLISAAAIGQTPVCEGPEAKAFDWQVGSWQSDDGKQVHEIRKIVDSCIVQENWFTEGKETAVGLKSFDAGSHDKDGRKRWFYTWLAKGYHQLWEGRLENGEWRFYRSWFFNGEPVLSRTYWTRISADKLERIVEQSRDGGKTWRPHVKDAFVRRSSK